MNEINNRNHYTKLPIGLPLDLHIKWAGNDHHYRFEEGDVIMCPWCGEDVTLTPGTVFRYNHPVDDNPRVVCENCEHEMSLAYFCSRKNLTKVGVWDAEFVKTEMDPSA